MLIKAADVAEYTTTLLERAQHILSMNAVKDKNPEEAVRILRAELAIPYSFSDEKLIRVLVDALPHLLGKPYGYCWKSFSYDKPPQERTHFRLQRPPFIDYMTDHSIKSLVRVYELDSLVHRRR